MNTLIALTMVVLVAQVAQAARILVVCPFFGRSHSIFIHPIVKAVAAKGHDITMISTNEMKDPPSNVKIIKPDYTDHPIAMDPANLYQLDSMPTFFQTWFVWKIMTDGTERTINTTAIKTFINEDKSHFDLIIMELFFHEALYALAHKYDAPMILLASGNYWTTADHIMGNPSTISFVGHEFGRDFGELCIFERTNNYVMGLFNQLYRLIYVPKHEAMIKKYFTVLKEPIPSVRELENRVSLMLINSHFSIDTPRPFVPGVIEVGGVHLKPPQKLPENLQKFLDEATDGFIYFSLGSNLRSASLPKDKLDGIVRALGALKQRVLWKWEDDNLPQLSSNIMTAKWFPQSDILAHPKIKMFITQTGMLSTQEAVHRGVPLIGIPVFGDQHMNIAKIVHLGMGISIPFSSFGEKALSEAINKILDDPKYTQMAKRVSARYNDRPNTSLETAVYWIEYVIRHGGGDFMKSRLVEMTWYQKNLLDVYLFLITIIYLVFFFMKRIIRGILNMFKKKDNKYSLHKKHT